MVLTNKCLGFKEYTFKHQGMQRVCHEAENKIICVSLCMTAFLKQHFLAILHFKNLVPQVVRNLISQFSFIQMKTRQQKSQQKN